MKSLVIGQGEVGKALFKVLYGAYGRDVDATDTAGYYETKDSYDILHICFPYSANFVQDVEGYQKQYKPKYTVIHSSIPVGTSEKCKAIHSPIRGLHPNLESGIRTFVKFIGGRQASDVADYFRRAGLRVCLFDKAETTEALKLFDTEYYRVCIEFALRVKTYCDINNLNFHEIYSLANTSYNEGYTALGHPEYVRPVLQPIQKEIGGHCVLNNKELIKMSENG